MIKGRDREKQENTKRTKYIKEEQKRQDKETRSLSKRKQITERT